jgi:hypothetical protein
VGRYNRVDALAISPSNPQVDILLFRREETTNYYSYADNTTLSVYDIRGYQTETTGPGGEGNTSSCDFYLNKCINTECDYPCVAWWICSMGDPRYGPPNSETNKCIRRCLINRYVLDENTPGCSKVIECDHCPTYECLYYDHDACFRQCGGTFILPL